jgi:hypothetical protein
MSNDLMVANNKLESVWFNLEYYPGICLEGLRATYLGRESWFPCLDSNGHLVNINQKRWH